MKYEPPKPRAKTSVEQVERIIKENPGIMTREIFFMTEMSYSVINNAVRRLKNSGRIHRSNEDDGKIMRWAAGPADDFVEPVEDEGKGQPKQVTVIDWESPKVSPQSWLSALEWKPGK